MILYFVSVLWNSREFFHPFLPHRSACLHLMEELMDMGMSPHGPQNYFFCCDLKADKDYHFKVDNAENEHQLPLRAVRLGAGAKDELRRGRSNEL